MRMFIIIINEMIIIFNGVIFLMPVLPCGCDVLTAALSTVNKSAVAYAWKSRGKSRNSKSHRHIVRVFEPLIRPLSDKVRSRDDKDFRVPASPQRKERPIPEGLSEDEAC
jgi:hypothetical protein